MALSRAEVEHVARLAHISLQSNEVDVLTEQLSSVVDHVASLQRVDTKDVEPSGGASSARNVMREDVVQPCWPPSAVLANVPRVPIGDMVEVQAVLE